MNEPNTPQERDGVTPSLGVSIRPTPKVTFRGEFVLCDGKRCKGKRCTFPHSVEERDAWNAEKFGRPSATTKPPELNSIATPEWPSLSPSQPAKKTSSGTPPSAWSQPIQEKWQQQSQPSSTAHQRFSTSPLAHAMSAGGPTAPSLPMYPPEQLQSCQVPKERYSSDSTTPVQLECHPNPWSEPPQVQPSSLVGLTSHSMFEGVSSKTTVQVGPEYLRLSLAALLSKDVNNMEPLRQHSQQPQQTGSSPWPDRFELGAKLHLSPVLIPSAAQVPMLGAQGGTTSPPWQPPPQAAVLPQSSQSSPLVASIPTFSRGNGTSPRHNYAAQATKFLARVQEELHIEDIQAELTRRNYKEKMHKLLCWEEKAHIEILSNKCNGQYTLVLYKAGFKPSWMEKEERPMSTYKRFGYILGLNGDQIAYATQASEGAYIVHEGEEVKVDILRENYSHTDERMYIALDRSNLGKLEKLTTLLVSSGEILKSQVKLIVEFELKHSYFNNLHAAVEHLSPGVIARILPEAEEFRMDRHLQNPDLQQCEQYCSQDQLNALRVIATCPSNGPPILIAGAFGTGKTHILAITAHNLFEESSKGNRPARVLVCTQQRVSADTFLECYLKLMRPQREEIYLIRDYGFKKPNLERWYCTVAEFQSYIERNSHCNRSNFLIVTPCLTALHLANIISQDFFTHILLDEGAQTREPEAVAPLCMAGRNTKIVIAGDQNQVGPAMLVLGDEAQENGLAVSLLERLHTLYGKLGEVAGDHCATLVTNYRCHRDILKLAEKLFYDLALECKVPDSVVHPAAPYPLLFYCSSIDDKVQSIDSTINRQEAEITLKLVADFAKRWPSASWGRLDLSQMCIMSPTRSQLTVANRLINQLRLYQLKEMRRLPTYDIQGREFRALFLSTSEPTEKDGATCNPTKSICDRYVFNTAITRAQSLVVAVGNPFMLLRTERHMVQKYGAEGRCWSNYLKFCLKHSTLFIHDTLQVPETEKSRYMQKLRKLVGEHLARSSSDIWRAEDAVKVSLQQPQQQMNAAPPILSPTSSTSEFISRQQQWPSAAALLVSPKPTSPHQSVPKRHHPHLLTGSSSDTRHTRAQDKISAVQKKPTHEEALCTEVNRSAPTSKLEKEYDVKKRLGKGGFGVVYHVRNKVDRQEYAVKIIKLRPDQKRATYEAEVLAQLKHPNIVRYYTSWKEKAPSGWNDKGLWAALKSSDSTTSDEATEGAVAATVAPEPPTCLFIQTELCRGQTLQHWLSEHINDRLRKTVFNYFKQILTAVIYIHEKGLVHMDLKPSNIFRDDEDNLKVGDFGLVTGNFAAITSSLTPPGSGQSGISMDSIHYCVSPEKMAGGSTPQDQKQKEANMFGQMIDMYCLGLIYFELCCPFSNDKKRDEARKDLGNQILPQMLIKNLPTEAKLIQTLLKAERVRTLPESTDLPTAEYIHNCDLIKTLKRNTRTSHAYIHVL